MKNDTSKRIKIKINYQSHQALYISNTNTLAKEKNKLGNHQSVLGQ